MKLQNRSEAFEMLYDSKDFIIPKGDFEVTDTTLAMFIVDTAKKWDKQVIILDDSSSQSIKQEITQEAEVIKPETTETEESETEKVEQPKSNKEAKTKPRK